MADSQLQWGIDALEGGISKPALGAKPSWYLVAADDRMSPQPAQQMIAERTGATVVETSGSHSVYVSRPAAVADLIKRAADCPASGPDPAGLE